MAHCVSMTITLGGTLPRAALDALEVVDEAIPANDYSFTEVGTRFP